MPSRRKKPSLRPTQAIVISFVGLALLGGVLLCIPAAGSHGPLPGIDAFFLSTSAVCVTGLVTINTGADLSGFGHLIVLALIQVGGLGYMVISTLFMLLLGQRLRLQQRLLLREAMGQVALGSVWAVFRTVIVFTLSVELVGALLLAVLFRRYDVPWATAAWLGLFHAVSAFCNAGLDLFGLPAYGQPFGSVHAASLERFVGDPAVCLVFAALIVLGGIGFIVVLDVVGVARGEHRALSLHSKIVLASTAALLAGGALVFYLLERHNPSTLGGLSEPFRWVAALFQSVTARTAGFNSVPQAPLHPASKMTTIVLMVTGASPGGTGGGIKTTTAVIIFLAAAASLRGDENLTVYGREVAHQTVYRALAVLLGGVVVTLLCSFLLGITEPHGFAAGSTYLDYHFEAASAFGTVGLSTGVTPTLSTAGKLTVIATMLAGRIGPATLVIALAERGGRRLSRYPQEPVQIG